MSDILLTFNVDGLLANNNNMYYQHVCVRDCVMKRRGVCACESKYLQHKMKKEEEGY